MLFKKFFTALIYTLSVLPLISCGTEMGDQIAAGGIIGTGGVDETIVSINPSGTNDLIQNKKIVSIGAITALDGVTVNGIRYEVSNAAIIDNGLEVQNKDGYLGLGMVVEVQGTVDPDRTSGDAEIITIHRVLQGPVTGIDIAAGTFVIFGKTVQVSGETVYHMLPGYDQTGLSGLNVDQVYELSGFESSNGTVIATRIEQKQQDNIFEITGTVENLDRENSRFNIGTLIVNYLNAGLKHFEEKPLTDGDVVKVKGMPGEAPDTLAAVELELQHLRHNDMSDGEEYKVEGIIGSVDGSTLELNYGGGTTMVVFGNFTNFENGSVTDVADGRKAEIEGFITDGNLQADKISFKQNKDDDKHDHKNEGGKDDKGEEDD